MITKEQKKEIVEIKKIIAKMGGGQKEWVEIQDAIIRMIANMYKEAI